MLSRDPSLAGASAAWPKTPKISSCKETEVEIIREVFRFLKYIPIKIFIINNSIEAYGIKQSTTTLWCRGRRFTENGKLGAIKLGRKNN